jgi:hypothetical protein
MITTEQTRFTELRAKTDRDLTRLIDRRLHFAISCLPSGGHWRAEAEKVYTEAGVVIPLIYRLPASKRNQLEHLRDRLRILLEEDVTPTATRAYAAC